MMTVSFAFILVIAVVVALIVGVVLIVGMSRSRRQDQTYMPPTPVPDPASIREERSDILKQLANKEISKDEAEARLAELGAPVPAEMPPPPARSSGGSGCLIAAIIIGAVLVLFLMLFLSFYFVKVRVPHSINYEYNQPSVVTPAKPTLPEYNSNEQFNDSLELLQENEVEPEEDQP